MEELYLMGYKCQSTRYPLCGGQIEWRQARLWPGPGAQRARFPAPNLQYCTDARKSAEALHAVLDPAAAAIQTSVCCASSEVAPPLAGARWLKGRDIRKEEGGVTAEFRGSRDRTQGDLPDWPAAGKVTGIPRRKPGALGARARPRAAHQPSSEAAFRGAAQRRDLTAPVCRSADARTGPRCKNSRQGTTTRRGRSPPAPPQKSRIPRITEVPSVAAPRGLRPQSPSPSAPARRAPGLRSPARRHRPSAQPTHTNYRYYCRRPGRHCRN